MNTFDIIVIIILVWSLWSGWKNGILIQLSGIIGIVLGAWVAYKFSHTIGDWLNLKELPTEVLFLVVLLGVLICVVILCRVITRALKAGGLGFPLRLLGGLFGVAKGVLLLGLFLLAFEAVMPWVRLASKMKTGEDADKKSLPTVVMEAKSYRIIQGVGEFVFPYLAEGTRMIMQEFRDHNAEPEPVPAEPAAPVDSVDIVEPEYQLIEEPAGTSSDSLSVAGEMIES